MLSTTDSVEMSEMTLEELQSQHQVHERRLEELRMKGWLTPEEEMEQRLLKKRKLRLKDRMEYLRRAAS